MSVVFSFITGLIFSLGLIVCGLINPAKVLNFLDLTGSWDPSLAITMAVAVLVTGIGYRLVWRRGRAIDGSSFSIPGNTNIDSPLIAGAALFGLGWGLVGFCPGPALAAVGTGSGSAVLFTIAMLAGMAIARILPDKMMRAPRQPSASRG